MFFQQCIFLLGYILNGKNVFKKILTNNTKNSYKQYKKVKIA